MKKLLYCAAALATLLFAGSCQKENLEPVADGSVTYTITLADGVQTRGSNGYTEYDLYYEVYKTVDPTELETATPLIDEKVEMTSNTTNIGLELLNDQDYTVLFWANKKGEAWFNNSPDLRKVEMVQSASNNNDRDAFSGKDQIVNHNGSFSKTITLKRPFAQLNIATLIPNAGYDVTPLRSTVTVSDIPVAYNVATASPVGANTEVTFTENIVPVNKEITVDSKTYTLVAMNYVLVPTSNIEVTYVIDTPNGDVTNTIKNVPVKPNYRTNIIGNLLTSKADYTVEIKPGFEDLEGGNMVVEDDGIVKNINGDYEISNENGLAYAVNKLFANGGGTFYILNSLNMDGYQLTPPTLPSGVTVHLVGEMPVVTRAAAEPIVISGLDAAIIATVSDGATASFSNIVIEDFEGEGAAFVDQNNGTVSFTNVEVNGTADDVPALITENDGDVVIRDSEVNSQPATKEEHVGDTDNNGTVIDAENDITTFNALQTAVKSGVDVIDLSSDIEATNDTEEPMTLYVSNSVTINGKGYKLNTSASRGIRLTASDIEVTINDLDVVSKAVRVGTNDIRGISIDSDLNSVSLTLNDCSVDFTDASASDWSYAVNVTGNGTGHKVTVNGGTYEGANVINIWGKDHTVNIDGATLTSLYTFNDMYKGVCVRINMNESIPSSGSVLTIKNTTFNGNHAVATMDSGDNTITLENCTDNTRFAPVKVGSSYYYTLAEAVNAIQTEGTVTVLSSIEIESASVPVTIPSGKTVTLDLNGKTITGVDNSEKKFSIIDNRGNLTVKNGTMKLSATINSGWGRYSAVIANNPGGNLTLAENLVIEHLGGTDMAYGIDNLTNGKGTSAITTVNGATVKSPYRAIRQFLNGIEATNELYVKAGSKIIGSNKSIWMHDPSVKANSGKLEVEKGAELDGDVYLSVTAGSTEWPVSVSIAESALVNDSEVLSANVPEGYEVINDRGVYKVIRVVGTADALVEALENQYSVKFTDDIEINPANMSNAYGTTGINVKSGQSIDGDGHTLDIQGAGGTWDSGINTTGGLIKNITVTGSFRGIFINHNSTHSEKVVLENVTIDGTTYTISCDQGLNQGFEATGSTFKGWTSYAATLGNAKFTDCDFGEGNGYAYCRPYAPTEFVGCDFEAGFELDARASVTFENCTLGGVPLTADNLATLVTSNIANASVK